MTGLIAASGSIMTLFDKTDILRNLSGKDYCLNNMFNGCFSLTSAPELPATTLSEYCYYGMFDSCTALVESPILAAPKLVRGCYNYMFKGCSNFGKVAIHALYGPDGCQVSDCLASWLVGVADTGTFYNLITSEESYSVDFRYGRGEYGIENNARVPLSWGWSGCGNFMYGYVV